MSNEIIFYGDEVIFGLSLKKLTKSVSKVFKKVEKYVVRPAAKKTKQIMIPSFARREFNRAMRKNPNIKKVINVGAAVGATILTAGLAAPILAPAASAAAGSGLFAQAGALAQAAGSGIGAGVKTIGNTLWSGAKAVGTGAKQFVAGVTGQTGATTAATTTASSAPALAPAMAEVPIGLSAAGEAITGVSLAASSGTAAAGSIASSIPVMTKIGSTVASIVKTAGVVMQFLPKKSASPEIQYDPATGQITASGQGMTGVSSPAFSELITGQSASAPYTIVNESQTPDADAQLNKKKLYVYGGAAFIVMLGIMIISRRRK